MKRFIFLLALLAGCDPEPSTDSAIIVDFPIDLTSQPTMPRRYKPIETAPRDGTIIMICLNARGYQGWCKYHFWGESGHWQSVDDPDMFVMGEDEVMRDGQRSGDLLEWRQLHDGEIEDYIRRTEWTLGVLRQSSENSK